MAVGAPVAQRRRRSLNREPGRAALDGQGGEKAAAGPGDTGPVYQSSQLLIQQ